MGYRYEKASGGEYAWRGKHHARFVLHFRSQLSIVIPDIVFVRDAVSKYELLLLFNVCQEQPMATLVDHNRLHLPYLLVLSLGTM